jgi:hypothetical protein
MAIVALVRLALRDERSIGSARLVALAQEGGDAHPGGVISPIS